MDLSTAQCLITAPPSAIFPLRMVTPESTSSGLSTVFMISSGFMFMLRIISSLRLKYPFSSRALRFSAIVCPVTVMRPVSISPCSASSFIIRGIPPAYQKYCVGHLPAVKMEVRSGTPSVYLSKSSNVSSIPASLATAGRCSTAFADPPMAACTLMAFIKASFVSMLDGRMSFFTSSVTLRAAAWASWMMIFVLAGAAPAPGIAMPRVSDRHCIVVAVPMY